MKKVLALILAALMVLTLCGVAFADGEGGEGGEPPAAPAAHTITFNRGANWSADADAKNVTYTWYRIFDVDLTDAAHPVYTISGADADDKVAALNASVFEANEANGKYYITLKDGVTDDAVFASLAATVAASGTLFTSGTVTSAENPVIVDVGADGYYYIVASNGKDVAVQTIGSVTIVEKNDYPTIDKQQKKAAGEEYGNDEIKAEIGKVIDYKIIVNIPADANKAIAVIDKMSAGLTYNGDFAAKIGETVVTSSATDLTSSDTALGYVAEAPAGYTIPFQVKFDAAFVEAHQGEAIVITYTATVNEGALVPTGRENEAKLVYDEGNYVLHDTVEYTTYFGGIEKVDGTTTTTKLEGVKFVLTENGAAYNVTKVTVSEGQDYYVPGGDSNEVVTGANGLIIIRGLDNTKTYTLTETETKLGYNLLHTPKDLTLEEDLGTYGTKDNYDQVLNYSGTELPSTGGIGTTIFYVTGLIMVLGASVILVSRRRADAK